jgi:hypothetical protein
MRRWAVILLLLSTVVLAIPVTATPTAACFVDHLREAIALNRARADVYARLSEGESRSLSRRLVASELLTLGLAYPMEGAASIYWRAGIPILCEDFAPMSATLPVQTRLMEERPDLGAFQEADIDLIASRVREGMAADSFAGAHAALEHEIEALAVEPRFNCMTRHILESAARIAWLAPRYDALAGERDVKPAPSLLSRALLELHLQSLALARDLDGRAAPLASDGVSIICGDVPPIDTRPTL